MVHIRIFLRIGNKERQLLDSVIEYAFEDKVIIESTSNDHILDHSSQCQAHPKDSCKTFVIE